MLSQSKCLRIEIGWLIQNYKLGDPCEIVQLFDVVKFIIIKVLNKEG